METQIPGMTIGGWIFIVCAWGFILSITIFCFARVFGTRTRYSNSETQSEKEK
jgi:glycerol uptake facilitator-like aquaporin